MKIVSLLLCLTVTSLIGCGSPSPAPASDIHVGSQLYDGQKLWGTVIETSDAHTFENGAVEPGVLVDYGARMGNSPEPPHWLPTRSAQRFDVR